MDFGDGLIACHSLPVNPALVGIGPYGDVAFCGRPARKNATAAESRNTEEKINRHRHRAQAFLIGHCWQAHNMKEPRMADARALRGLPLELSYFEQRNCTASHIKPSSTRARATEVVQSPRPHCGQREMA